MLSSHHKLLHCGFSLLAEPRSRVRGTALYLLIESELISPPLLLSFGKRHRNILFKHDCRHFLLSSEQLLKTVIEKQSGQTAAAAYECLIHRAVKLSTADGAKAVRL